VLPFHDTIRRPTRDRYDLFGVKTVGFGETIHNLRKAKDLTLRALGEKVGVSFAYISKVENSKLDFGDYPSEDLIRRLAEVLDADEEAMLLLAEKIPDAIRRRFFERPEAFRLIARLDDRRLDRLLVHIKDG
jgi:HTH-type transcriptional regulator, competence development regulator